MPPDLPVTRRLLIFQYYTRSNDSYVPFIWHRIKSFSARYDLVALDVVKTRIQIDPALAHQSLISGGRYIVSKEGPAALLTGFGPTAFGYLVQGGAKFAGYEYWKKTFVQIAGDQQTATKYRTAIYLGSASVAE